MQLKGHHVEVKIGVQNARELTIETEQSAAEVTAAVRDAISDGSGVLTLTDARGREVLVSTAALAYVQIGDAEKGRVGFGTVPMPR